MRSLHLRSGSYIAHLNGRIYTEVIGIPPHIVLLHLFMIIRVFFPIYCIHLCTSIWTQAHLFLYSGF